MKKIPRPCVCDHCTIGGPYVKGQDCLLCWQYHNDPRYHKLWSPPGPEDNVRTTVSPSLLGGAGTELVSILAWMGQLHSDSCECLAKAQLMDREGVEWCEQNKKIIHGWLMDAWDKREMSLDEFLPPFIKKYISLNIIDETRQRNIAERGASWAISTAIRRAKKKAKNISNRRKATA